MRRAPAIVALSFAVGASACRRETERTEPAPSAEPSSAPIVPRSHVTRRAAFATATVRVSIEDVHMSSRLDDAFTRNGADLVVNGGFFDVDTKPLGLAVSERKAISPFSKGMSGGVLSIRDGVARLTASEDYEGGAVDFAIQCRPRLVVGSRRNIRSDDGHRARRTAICVRDAGRTIEFFIAAGSHGDPDPTLFELATELTALGCEEALNLDGGPSTGWVARADGGLDVDPPRAGIRHAIVIQRN